MKFEKYYSPDILNQVFNTDGVESLKNIPANSINCILTDPPYKYLKGQKLEVDWDEQLFFPECRRILKDSGFIILFGRGTAFYRWNTILANMGFLFKEEFVWNKKNSTSPVMPVARIHETISIHSKKTGKIQQIKVPYMESRKYDFEGLVRDIKRLKTVFKNKKDFKIVEEYIETLKRNDYKNVHNVSAYQTSIQSTSRLGRRVVNVAQAIIEGMKPKTILEVHRDHYNTIHPTQKPVKVLELLLKLTTKQGAIVLDPFAGSLSTAEACIKLGRNFICYEIDEEYFLRGKARLDKLTDQQSSLW